MTSIEKVYAQVETKEQKRHIMIDKDYNLTEGRGNERPALIIYESNSNQVLPKDIFTTTSLVILLIFVGIIIQNEKNMKRNDYKSINQEN